MPKLRLAEILLEHKKRCGSLPRLLEAITAASGGKGTIATRKLKAIIDGTVKSLSLSDLRTLDMFLTPFGQSLSDVSLFDADGVLSAIAENGQVVFFARTKVFEKEHRDYSSVWDVRAFSSIDEKINRRWPKTRTDLKPKPGRVGPHASEEPDWGGLLEGTDASCCCLGAPLVFGLAEYMLAKMFGVAPFEPYPRFRRVDDLPFHFVWYPDPEAASGDGTVRSHFALNADDLVAAKLKLPSEDFPEAIKKGKAQAFLVGDKVYPVELDQPRWKEYGVVVVQRRYGGRAWALVGGLSGPGTFAAAELLESMYVAIPEPKPGEVSPPAYAVVESVVRRNPNKTLGDPREVVGQVVLCTPELWKP